MVNPEDDVLVGYWHNWPAGNKDGYKGGSSAAMDLTDIRKEYNVIDASFMKSVGNGTIPTFKPYNMTDAEFRAQIGELNQDGRAVLMALGGADAHIELKESDKEAFKAEIIRMVDTYGFDGLDIDLEQNAITAGDNETVIPEVLREVKDHYKAQGKNFLITMAPEFPYLKPGEAYEAYIKGLDGYYDWINPQLYNQGGDGVWVDELNLWLTQNNDDMKEEFLYYMADSLSQGTRGYLQIPADKLVLGLPTNNDAAATGYVIDPADVKGAMDRLKAEGNLIKGLMTWSVNWDAGKDKDGKAYNWEFVNRYAPMLFGDAKK
ncbi:chitinase [Listeria grandensis]|nr:chitinase [Listeria grandensis]